MISAWDFCSALAVIVGVWLCYVYFSQKKRKDYLNSIPGPPGLPILGNALELGSTTVLLDALMKYTKTYGGITKVHLGIKQQLIISDYKFLEFLMSSNKILKKSPEYNFLHNWLGTGLLTSDGQKWKRHRKTLTPAFHFKILEEFIGVFERVGNVMVEKLKKNMGQSINIYSYVTLCTLDIICETAMGTTVNAQSDENSEYVKSVKEMCRILIERSFSFIGSFPFLYPLTSNYYTEIKALTTLHDYTNRVIRLRREELKRKGVEKKEDGHDVGMKKRMTFLDMLLQATIDGKPLTQDEIREEVDTFMFEGHDTTASGISFSLYCLANYPEVQDKAYKEQQEIFGDATNPTVTYSNLQDMKYLESVIKESLRVYPSVPFYGRETNEEVVFNGTVIPEGVSIMIFAYGAHRNPEYFPEPEKFDPDRFDRMSGKLPYAYIPFSAGSRNCIGQKFAMLEMKSAISNVLRNFELLPAVPQHTLRLAAEAVLKSANGIRIGLRPRT